jgi:signal transduction histidine kinase
MVEKITENQNTEDLVKDFLKNTLKEIMSIFKAECGSLFLFDSRTKELILDSFYNTQKIQTAGVRRRLGEGVSGKVVEKRTPVLVKDIDQDCRFPKNGFKHYQTKSFISIPLISSDRLIGLINIADKGTGEPFTEEDLRLATTLTEYACIIAHNLSLSERLRKEKDALDKQNSLLEKYASVGKLAAGVVHEINNPLDGIIRFTNMLLHQIDNNSIAREYLLEIKRGLNRIDNITKSLFQFSHQVNLHNLKVKNYVDLHELIEESLAVFSSSLFEKIQVTKNFSLSKLRILDVGLSHAFINIIKNALDAMPRGGSLDISTEVKDSFVKISFKDTGMGIPDEFKERIFEPFFTTKNIDKGAGLGLSICREIVSRYEGKIELESSVDKGSTFVVLIPVKFLENV